MWTIITPRSLILSVVILRPGTMQIPTTDTVGRIGRIHQITRAASALHPCWTIGNKKLFLPYVD